MRSGLLLAGLLVPAVLVAQEKSFEKTIPVPRSGDAKLGWSHADCTVESLTLRNHPSSEEIEDARRKDPGDKAWLLWEFNLENRGSRDCKVKLWVEVLDSKGNVLKASDRSGTVDAGELDDDIRMTMLVKTLDVADAPKVRIRADIRPK